MEAPDWAIEEINDLKIENAKLKAELELRKTWVQQLRTDGRGDFSNRDIEPDKRYCLAEKAFQVYSSIQNWKLEDHDIYGELD